MRETPPFMMLDAIYVTLYVLQSQVKHFLQYLRLVLTQFVGT